MTQLAVDPKNDRLLVDTCMAGAALEDSLADDVRVGLGSAQKWLPPKHFYDDEGSHLFDAICETPEYYQTRTEARLLEGIAGPLMDHLRPTQIIELGSGAARKTRILLEANHAAVGAVEYVPLDVSEGMLRHSARQLLEDYPWLSVHGVVGDYAETLGRLPEGDRRLVVFLGSTIGNLTPDEAVSFLGKIRAGLHEGDALLLGVDLVKDHAVLNAAYNDAQGITARFNKNVLKVINEKLGADFELDTFEHRAFYAAETARIEMHLVSTRAQEVHIPGAGLTVSFARGESLHTEISRKFTHQSVAGLFDAAGLSLGEWYTSDNDYFALALGLPAAP